MAQADHVLVVAGKRGEGSFEEEAVGGKGGLGEWWVFDPANDFAGGVVDDEFGLVAFELLE